MTNQRKCWAAALAVSCAAVGCATTSVQTDRDPAVDLASYKTYEVRAGQLTRDGVVDQRDTLVRDRLETAIADELQAKGLQPAAAGQKPDLIATYSAGSQQVLEVYDDELGEGYYGPAWGGEYIEEETEGRLIIDLMDATTNKLVWRSIVEVEDDDDIRSAKTIDKAVDKGLEKYPGPLTAVEEE